MKQKDKKKQRPPVEDRLKNISLPDLDVLDDVREKAGYKALRTAGKQHDKFKSGAELIPGQILEIKSNYLYIVEAGHKIYTATLCGRLKQFSYASKALSAVGDRVELDISNTPHYRIENILPRHNTLSRYAGGSFQKEIILAANIDQVIITTSWRMPMIKPGLIDRYLCIAALEDIDPVIVINKVDLCEDREELAEITQYYLDSGFPVLCTSTVSGEGMEALREILKDKDSVFSGQSGTGKSSLINWLEPALDLTTAEVSDFNEKGKHTTTQSILLPWGFGGHLLDTPGIKTVNLHKDAKADIPKVFPGFRDLAPLCRFRDCTHTHEDDCAVLAAYEDDSIPVERYESYLRIMESL
jgi:ribosome biogenesis GTPase